MVINYKGCGVLVASRRRVDNGLMSLFWRSLELAKILLRLFVLDGSNGEGESDSHAEFDEYLRQTIVAELCLPCLIILLSSEETRQSGFTCSCTRISRWSAKEIRDLAWCHPDSEYETNEPRHGTQWYNSTLLYMVLRTVLGMVWSGPGDCCSCTPSRAAMCLDS